MNVLPAMVDQPIRTGRYQSISASRRVPIQQAILRSLHQCLIAEVAFDPVPIPLGKDPGELGQARAAQPGLERRRLGARPFTTFEIKPTPVGLSSGQLADELMIDWGATPRGSARRSIFPSASADEILDLASRMYVSHHLERVDEHTLDCPARRDHLRPDPARAAADD